MKAEPALPFLTATEDAVAATHWEMQSFGTDDWEPLGERVDSWDPQRVILLRREVVINVDTIKATCRLANQDSLRLCVVVWSREAGVRRRVFTTNKLQSGRSEHAVKIELTGESLAANVRIDTEIVIDAPVYSRDIFAPRIPGSRLWQHSHQVEIEGDRSQFPVESGDFESMPWIPSPHAPWHLEIDAEDLSAPFLATVRLYLNSANKVVCDLDSRPLVRSVLNYDVARSMLSAVILQQHFLDNVDHFESGSLGATVRDLLKVLFPGESARDMATQLRSHPYDFDTRIRAATRMLHE